MCACGKKYQSFPATYLHFKTKHDIKLSTKPTEKRKKVTINGEYRIITYTIELNFSENASQEEKRSIKGD